MSNHAAAHHIPKDGAPGAIETAPPPPDGAEFDRTGSNPDESDLTEGDLDACSLVNPATGLANDYLNVFNEALLLIEFLPTMPEMAEEALAWRPRDYRAYFEASPLPGAGEALKRYERIDARQRRKFESLLARLNEIVASAQREVAAHMEEPDFPDSIAAGCEETAAAMRIGLEYVARLINEGPAESAGRKSAAS